MARKSRKKKKPIEQYDHRDKERINNPPIGLVTAQTDKVAESKTSYQYDSHLDPQLQWAGKAEHTSFEIPTVSLHVHERIEPITIIEAVRKKNGEKQQQLSLFTSPEENPPLREAIEFYKHKHNWSNRLIAGDSLLVMNSLLKKEGMDGQVQMIYIDPPYGISYSSNFQPFIKKRKVKNRSDEDLTTEPEMIKAFRDTWELGIHSYLTYLRDRLLLAKELLTESGSCFLQISDENVHLVRNLMDEVFGKQNFIAEIRFKCRVAEFTKYIPTFYDYLIWYGKDKEKTKCHQLFFDRPLNLMTKTFDYLEMRNGKIRHLSKEEVSNPAIIPKGARPFKAAQLPTNEEEISNIKKARRIVVISGKSYYKRYADDFPYLRFGNQWEDTVWSTFASGKIYVVQTHETTITRCILMTTDPGDLVVDPTCGSGTTAFVSEQWGRRWITCDTSRIAISLSKQRLMTALFDYYQLAHPNEGVGSGFLYESAKHITQTTIAKGESPIEETLYDKSLIDNTKSRVSGPFTIEAVPSPVVKSLSEIEKDKPADVSISRSGETLRQAEWRDELLKTGIRGKGGQQMNFSHAEPLPGTRWLHVDGETKEKKPQRIVVSFGPEHAPLEQRQVELAIEEARKLVPKPEIIVFAAFQFDPEAAKDIDETEWPGVTLLKAQMNADLLTEDLKKERTSNQSFWLIGQPDIRIKQIKEKKKEKKYRVEVLGFDYYNTISGNIESGGTEKIAMWLLDTDYDGRSLFPRQVFFPMAGKKEGWTKLARNLKAEIDEELIEAYRGTVSLPFKLGKNRRIAVKIVDDRGIESLKIIEVDNGKRKNR